MSLVISTFGDNLQKDLPACLPILVDRMGNEITRLTAVKVIFTSSELSIIAGCGSDIFFMCLLILFSTFIIPSAKYLICSVLIVFIFYITSICHTCFGFNSYFMCCLLMFLMYVCWEKGPWKTVSLFLLAKFLRLYYNYCSILKLACKYLIKFHWPFLWAKLNISAYMIGLITGW